MVYTSSDVQNIINTDVGDLRQSVSNRSEWSLWRSTARRFAIINTVGRYKPCVEFGIDGCNTNLSRFTPGDCACRISAQDVLSVQTNNTSGVIQRGDETSLYECGSCNTNRYSGIQNICNFKVNRGDSCCSTNDISNDTSSDLDISEISSLSVKCSDRSVGANQRGYDASSDLCVDDIAFCGINRRDGSSCTNNVSNNTSSDIDISSIESLNIYRSDCGICTNSRIYNQIIDTSNAIDVDIAPLLSGTTQIVGIVIIRNDIRVNLTFKYDVIGVGITKTNCATLKGYTTYECGSSTNSEVTLYI